MTQTILHIDASARIEGSISRNLSAQIVEHLKADHTQRRDLAAPLPQVTESWIGANFTPPAERDALQQDILALSDQLINELKTADTIVIGTPIYNFAVPSALKAWIDLVCRAGLTFQYTKNGPEGLLSGKRMIIAMASGGTQVGSDIDFASGYLRHIMGFIGITDVEIIAADQMAVEPEGTLKTAKDAVRALGA